MIELDFAAAAAGFPAVLVQVTRGEPILVTRDGKPVAVVASFTDWQRLVQARPSFAELLLAFPAEPSPPGLDP